MTVPARIGVIGGGIWGGHHLRAARQLERSGRLRLVSVAARTQGTADRLAGEFEISGYTDYRQMLDVERLDAVTVATPDHLHRDMTLEALKRGIHVLVEKPLDVTVEGCLEIAERARQERVLVQVDFHKRFDPHVIDVRDQLAAGGIGTPQYGYAYMEDQIVVPADWLRGWAANSSPFWFLGTHKYDLLRWLTGREAVSVLAHGAKGNLVDLGIDTYDAVNAHIQFDGGFSATIHVSWALPRSFDAVVNQGLRLVGTDGLVELDTKNRGLRYCLHEKGITTPNPNALQNRDGPRGARTTGYFMDGITDFLENVQFLRHGADVDVLAGHYADAVDGLRATELAAAVASSLETGDIVTIDRHLVG